MTPTTPSEMRKTQKPNTGNELLDQLIQRALAGERSALARAISVVENEMDEATAILDAAFPRTGQGTRLGFTGPPGAGKSTLVSSFARLLRERGEKVAIVAVDPTSPFSGGALLGDRVRMPKLAGDDGVFIRSMASRGSLGGLAVTTSEVCDVLEAAGFRWILIETVGVGQSELEVAESADSVLVVLVPESGDGVQAMKAGLMEIGDVFVLNKSDRDGADRAAAEIRSVLGLKSPGGWRPPVVMTEARSDQGVDDLLAQIERHMAYLRENDLLRKRRRRRMRGHVLDLIRGRVSEQLREKIDEARWTDILTALEKRETTPHHVAEELWKEAWPTGETGKGA